MIERLTAHPQDLASEPAGSTVDLEGDVLGIGGGRLPLELEHTDAVAPEAFEVRVRPGAGIDPYARAQNPLKESVRRRHRGLPNHPPQRRRIILAALCGVNHSERPPPQATPWTEGTERISSPTIRRRIHRSPSRHVHGLVPESEPGAQATGQAHTRFDSTPRWRLGL